MAYHQLPPNTQLNRIKRFYRGKQKQQFGDKVQDCHDGSRLQFIKFDFMAGGHQIKLPNCGIFTLLAAILSF